MSRYGWKMFPGKTFDLDMKDVPVVAGRVYELGEHSYLDRPMLCAYGLHYSTGFFDTVWHKPYSFSIAIIEDLGDARAVGSDKIATNRIKVMNEPIDLLQYTNWILDWLATTKPTMRKFIVVVKTILKNKTMTYEQYELLDKLSDPVDAWDTGANVFRSIYEFFNIRHASHRPIHGEHLEVLQRGVLRAVFAHYNYGLFSDLFEHIGQEHPDFKAAFRLLRDNLEDKTAWL